MAARVHAGWIKAEDLEQPAAEAEGCRGRAGGRHQRPWLTAMSGKAINARDGERQHQPPTENAEQESGPNACAQSRVNASTRSSSSGLYCRLTVSSFPTSNGVYPDAAYGWL